MLNKSNFLNGYKVTLIFFFSLFLLSCQKENPSKKTSATSSVQKDERSKVKKEKAPFCEVTFSENKLPESCTSKDTRYQALFINGQKSGYAISGRLEKGKLVKSCEFSKMLMKRGAVTLNITNIVETTETVTGEPIGFQSLVLGGGMKKEVCGKLQGKKMKIVQSTAGFSHEKTLDWEDGAKMFEGLRLALLEKGIKKGVAFSIKGLEIESQSIATYDVKILNKEPVDLLGKVSPSFKMHSNIIVSGSMMNVTQWIDDLGFVKKSQMSIMGMLMETVECEKEYALTSNNPSEVFTASFLDSPKILDKKQLLGPINYYLKPKDGKVLEFPSMLEQKVTKVDGKFVLKVNSQSIPKGITFPYKGSDGEAISALEPTSWIQSDKSEIISLSKKAVKNAKDVKSAAENIETFVSKYIENRSLSVGYASALEVVKSKQGDCTEFALLTAALARAQGIPARVVFGLVYMPEEFEGRKDFFGGHAWTQVYADGNWYNLDAAMYGFNSGHIAVDVTDGSPSSFFKLITTMGYFDIVDIKIP